MNKKYIPRIKKSLHAFSNKLDHLNKGPFDEKDDEIVMSHMFITKEAYDLTREVIAECIMGTVKYSKRMLQTIFIKSR